MWVARRCVGSLLAVPWSTEAATASIHISATQAAARKGTRAKAESKKKASKKEEVKKEFVPYKKKLEMRETGGVSPRRDDSHLPLPTDDIFITKFYQRKTYTLSEAIALHRETHHPTSYNTPNPSLTALIELDMALDKKNKFLENLKNVLHFPHSFETGQKRRLCVITRSEEIIEYAREKEVELIAGTEIVGIAKKGEINFFEFDHILADVEILPDILPLRALVKRKFPAVKSGSSAPAAEMRGVIDRFDAGLEYAVVKNRFHPDYATIAADFGRLDMPEEQLEENLHALMQDIEGHAPKNKSTPLVTKCLVSCAPSPEKFMMDVSLYTGQQEQQSEARAVAQ